MTLTRFLSRPSGIASRRPFLTFRLPSYPNPSRTLPLRCQSPSPWFDRKATSRIRNDHFERCHREKPEGS